MWYLETKVSANIGGRWIVGLVIIGVFSNLIDSMKLGRAMSLGNSYLQGMATYVTLCAIEVQRSLTLWCLGTEAVVVAFHSTGLQEQCFGNIMHAWVLKTTSEFGTESKHSALPLKVGGMGNTFTAVVWPWERANQKGRDKSSLQYCTSLFHHFSLVLSLGMCWDNCHSRWTVGLNSFLWNPRERERNNA